MLRGKIILLALFSINCASKAVFAAGTNSLEFLTLGAGSRSIALGGATTAATDDISSISRNPAALATTSEFKTSFMYNEHIQKIHYSHAAAAMPLGSDGKTVLGFGLYNLSIRNIPEYDHTGTRLNTVSAYNNMASVTVAREAAYWLLLGASFKFAREQLYTKTVSARMIDIGFWHPTEIPYLSVGGSILNIGPGVRYDTETFHLPRTYTFGASYNLPILNRTVIVLAENAKVRNESSGFRAGVELNTIPGLSFRTGYTSQNKAGSKFSFGLGFQAGKIKLDYAVSQYGALGDSHSITFEYLPEPSRKSSKHQLREEESEILYNKAAQAYVNEKDIQALELLKAAKRAYPKNAKITSLQNEVSRTVYAKADDLYMKENKTDEAAELLRALLKHFSHRDSKLLLDKILKEKSK